MESTKVRSILIAVFIAAASVVALPSANAEIGQQQPPSSAIEILNPNPTQQRAPRVGCTAAPGSWPSQVCVEANFTVNSVITSKVTHTASQNICDATAQIRYQGRWKSGLSYTTGTASGCTPLAKYVTFGSAGSLMDGSEFCGRIKDSATSQKYSNYACIGV